jgi:hypothetical protein
MSDAQITAIYLKKISEPESPKHEEKEEDKDDELPF